MDKKDFIALAEYIRDAERYCEQFSDRQVAHLANFCHQQNPRFNRERWVGFIKGTNGPNGGKR